MDAVEFFKTANRLCKNQSCRKCPACKNGVCMVMNMVRLDGKLVESIEETVSKV
jgi:NADH:ubiquinone oxidoreductase subunit F (NADH-binding)